MFSLPSLAPTDAHTLWYQSSSHPAPTTTPATQNNPALPAQHQQRRTATGNTRTPLARLKHDEEYIALRKSHITTYGSTWLRPPGISKTLHQQKEEKREAEDHAEAVRREQLAQELAEAEAREEEGDGEIPIEEDDEAGRDLDEDVPEAEASEEEEDEDEDDEDEDSSIQEVHRVSPSLDLQHENSSRSGYPINIHATDRVVTPQGRMYVPRQIGRLTDPATGETDLQYPSRRGRISSRPMRRDLEAQHSPPSDIQTRTFMRPPPAEDAIDLQRVRLRNDLNFLAAIGATAGATEDEEMEHMQDESQLLQESDLYHEETPSHNLRNPGVAEMAMDLDADVPEAGGYEHTDSDEELESSEEEESEEEGMGNANTNGGGFGGAGFGTSIVRSDGTQNSLDLSALQQSSPPVEGFVPSAYRSRRS